MATTQPTLGHYRENRLTHPVSEACFFSIAVASVASGWAVFTRWSSYIFYLCLTFYLLYINHLPNNVICNINIYADDTTLYSKCNPASDLWQQLDLAAKLESDLWDTVGWDRKWLANFNTDWFSLTGLLTLMLLMWKLGDLFLKKIRF